MELGPLPVELRLDDEAPVLKLADVDQAIAEHERDEGRHLNLRPQWYRPSSDDPDGRPPRVIVSRGSSLRIVAAPALPPPQPAPQHAADSWHSPCGRVAVGENRHGACRLESSRSPPGPKAAAGDPVTQNSMRSRHRRAGGPGAHPGCSCRLATRAARMPSRVRLCSFCARRPARTPRFEPNVAARRARCWWNLNVVMNADYAHWCQSLEELHVAGARALRLHALDLHAPARARGLDHRQRDLHDAQPVQAGRGWRSPVATACWKSSISAT